MSKDYLVQMEQQEQNNSFDPKIYWENRLQKHYDLQGVGDISLSPNYNYWSYKVTRIQFDSLIAKYSSSSKEQALDIGSGTGFIVKILEARKLKVTGIDISETAVRELRKKFPASNFQVIDLGTESHGFDKSSFSIITASSVLYHIVEDEKLIHLLNQVRDMLAINGVFIFSDNFPQIKEFSIQHQKCRTLSQYKNILTQCGLEIVERRPNYFLFNDPVDARGRLVRLIWRLLTSFSAKSRFFDSFIWPMLFPLELLIVKTCKESPAQEIMVVKRAK